LNIWGQFFGTGFVFFGNKIEGKFFEYLRAILNFFGENLYSLGEKNLKKFLISTILILSIVNF